MIGDWVFTAHGAGSDDVRDAGHPAGMSVREMGIVWLGLCVPHSGPAARR